MVCVVNRGARNHTYHLPEQGFYSLDLGSGQWQEQAGLDKAQPDRRRASVRSNGILMVRIPSQEFQRRRIVIYLGLRHMFNLSKVPSSAYKTAV